MKTIDMTDRTLGAHDPFQDVTNWNQREAREWVETLDSRANALNQRQLRRTLISLAKLRAGDIAVEVGSGTGALLIDIARILGDAGKAIGVEPQCELAAVARRRLTGANAIYEIVDGFADHLPLQDDIATATLAQTVLIHLPLAVVRNAIKEMTRVTRSGGRVISVDQDADTWVLDHPDRELTRRIIGFNSDQRFADGWRGRQLRRLFLEAGLNDVVILPWIHTDTSRPSYLFSLAQRIANAAAAAKVITEMQCKSWLDELDSAADHGVFFSSQSFFIAVGVS